MIVEGGYGDSMDMEITNTENSDTEGGAKIGIVTEVNGVINGAEIEDEEMLEDLNVGQRIRGSLLDNDGDGKVTETSEASDIVVYSEISVTDGLDVGVQSREESVTADDKDARVLPFPAGDGPPTTD